MGHGEKNSQRAYLVSIASISRIPKCSRAGPSRAKKGHSDLAMSRLCLRPKRGFDVDRRKVGADVSALQRVIGIPALCTSTAHCGIGSVTLTCAYGPLAKSFGYVVKCRID